MGSLMGYRGTELTQLYKLDTSSYGVFSCEDGEEKKEDAEEADAATIHSKGL